MRRATLTTLALVGLVLLAHGALAEDRHVCTLAKDSGSVNVNTTNWKLAECCTGSACTATSGTLSSSGKYMVQCLHDDWTCVRTGTGVSLAASCFSDGGTPAGARIPPMQFYDLKLNGGSNIAVIRADAGVVDCNIFAVTP